MKPTFPVKNYLSDTSTVTIQISRKEKVMLSFDEFIELLNNADEETRLSIEELLASGRSQSESLDLNPDILHTS